MAGNSGPFNLYNWNLEIIKTDLLPTALRKLCLKNLTPVLHKPLKLGDRGGLNLHAMNSSAKKFDNSWLGE